MGAHGRIGGQIFIAGYLLAVLIPFPPVSDISGLVALVIVIVTATVTPISLTIVGGGGAGEALGLILAVFAWVGRFAGPAMASWLGPDDLNDALWRVVGASLPALLFALAALVLAFVDRA